MHKETKKFPKKELGRKGEQLAENHLLNKGWKILERNYKCSYAEIDLIAMDAEVLVFVEVKTRSSDFFGPPEAFVSPQQEATLFEAAMLYMDRIDHEWEIRFDIIGILFKGSSYQLKHIKDAFIPGMEG